MLYHVFLLWSVLLMHVVLYLTVYHIHGVDLWWITLNKKKIALLITAMWNSPFHCTQKTLKRCTMFIFLYEHDFKIWFCTDHARNLCCILCLGQRYNAWIALSYYILLFCCQNTNTVFWSLDRTVVQCKWGVYNVLHCVILIRFSILFQLRHWSYHSVDCRRQQLNEDK
jgi:hypothetical protein